MAVTVIQFGEFKLDCDRFELCRAGSSLKLERKPMELLILLTERNGHLVTSQEIAERLWDRELFVDTEHGINTAIRKIRIVLGDDPEQPHFVQTVTGKGYRFIGPIVEVDPPPIELLESLQRPPDGRELAGGDAPPVVASTGNMPVLNPAVSDREPAAHQAQRSRGFQIPIRVAVMVSAVLIVLAILVWVRRSGNRVSDQIAQTGIRSVAVLPLDNLSGDPGQEYFADGMTDELITMLAKNSTLRVTSRTSVMQYKGARRPLREIAQALGVDGILEGSVARSGDKVHMTIQLIQAPRDTHVWAESYDRDASDFVAVSREAAQTIAKKLNSSAVQTAPQRYVSPEAHDDYLRGRFFLDKRDANRSVAYFQQALSIDPTYASAYAGLASALESQAAMGTAQPEEVGPRAIAAAKRAIELDPENGEAYTALGIIETTYEWNWAAAERDLRRGTELSPNDSLAEMYYAVYLDVMNRPEEAVAHMRRALVLDPLSFFTTRHMGSALFFARQYDEALYYLRRAGEMEPNRADVVENWISWIYEKRGKRDEAVNHDLASLVPDTSEADRDKLRETYRRSGWKAYWRARIDEMSADPESCAPYLVGVGYLRLGDRDRAFLWLNKAIQARCLWVIWLQVDPLVDDIRTDERFTSMLREVKLTG